MKTLRLTLTPFLSTLVLLVGLALSGPFTAIFAASAPAQSKIENPKSKIPRPYPLNVCIVTDNDLGSMGEETTLNYNGQLIKFCCKPCEAKFLKDPAKYLPKLTAPESAPAKK